MLRPVTVRVNNPTRQPYDLTTEDTEDTGAMEDTGDTEDTGETEDTRDKEDRPRYASS
jgi:hypothetical protein